MRPTSLGMAGLAMVAAALLGTAAGCGSLSPGQTPSSHPDERPASAPPSGAAAPGLTASEIASLPLPGLNDVTQVRVAGDRVAFAACHHCSNSDFADTLYTASLRPQRITEVARSDWPSGEIGWQGLTGDRLAWLDLAHVPREGAPLGDWRLWIENLGSGRRRLLATNDGPDDPFPLPEAAGGSFVWLRASDGGHTRSVVVLQPEARRPHTVARHVLAFTAWPAGDRVVYDDGWPPGRPGASLSRPVRRREVFSVPIGGGTATDLGGGHTAHLPVAAGTWAVWGQPEYGDQGSIWGAPADGSSKPRELARTTSVGISGGDGFAAFWKESEGIFVVGTTTAAGIQNVEPRASQTYIPAHFAASGHELVYATVTGARTAHQLVTCHVVRVTAG